MAARVGAERTVQERLARRRSALWAASSVQSNARPSLCSEAPPLPHGRPIGPNPPPYLRTSQWPRYVVPGFACGRHFVCGW